MFYCHVGSGKSGSDCTLQTSTSLPHDFPIFKNTCDITSFTKSESEMSAEKPLNIPQQIGVWLMAPLVHFFTPPADPPHIAKEDCAVGAESCRKSRSPETTAPLQSNNPYDRKLFSQSSPSASSDFQTHNIQKTVTSIKTTASSKYRHFSSVEDPFAAEKARFDDLMAQYNKDFDDFTRGINRDVVEKDNRYEINVDLFHYKKEETKLELNGRILSIVAKRMTNTEDNSTVSSRSDIFDGTFSRTLTLPDNADLNQIESKYTDGRLMIRIPKTAGNSRSIPIK